MNENNEQDTIDELETDDDADVTIYEQKIDKRRKQSNIPHIPETFLNFTRYVQRCNNFYWTETFFTSCGMRTSDFSIDYMCYSVVVFCSSGYCVLGLHNPLPDIGILEILLYSIITLPIHELFGLKQ